MSSRTPKNSSTPCRDYLDFSLKTLNRKNSDGGLEVEFKYKYNSNSSNVKLSFKQKIFKIVEFVDANNNGILDKNESVKEIVPGDSSTNPWITDRNGNTFSEVEQNQNNSKVYKYTATTGLFEVVAFYSGDPVSFVLDQNGTSVGYVLDPNAVKFDFNIRGWNYAKPGTSMLAVVGKVRTEGRFSEKKSNRFHSEKSGNRKQREVECDKCGGNTISTDDQGNSTTSGAAFTWSTSVLADGQNVNVMVNPLTDDPDLPSNERSNNKQVVWVFNTTAAVSAFLWDPVLGAVDPSATALNGASISAAGIMAVVPALLAFLFQ